MSNNDTTKKQAGSSKRPTEEEEQTKADEAKDQEVMPSKSIEKLKEKDNQPHSLKEVTQGQHQIGKSITPLLPYPQRFNKEAKDQHFHKFLETFKKLEINIPLAEALEQMPLIVLNNALCDLGASINLMSLSMMRKLAIEELKPTRMSLVMADRSTKTPSRIVENLLVKVGEFIFPADFVILDTEEEGNNSIILGRPFLATARAIIDVEKGEIIFRVHNEQMVINVFKSIQHIPEQENYVRVDMIESLVEEMLEESPQTQEGNQGATEEQVAETSIE
ncbi:uncharacterized protein LOC130975011 [Arachis stenosperma]|uniref:uncharacterized protein LOC130975011 n=1 Tax=Arachis stenosperma TaxID=217475 RepID=UPI0025ACBDBE|nr:uncharacterized protein LOC130975011 [Arachis stenosperma]